MNLSEGGIPTSSDLIARAPIPDGDGSIVPPPAAKAARARVTTAVPAEVTKVRAAASGEIATAVASPVANLNPGREVIVPTRGRPPAAQKGRAMSIYFRDAVAAEELLTICGRNGGSASRMVEALVKALLEAHKKDPGQTQITLTVNLHI